MSNHRGFTLIEVMVALVCIVGALSVITHVSMTFYRSWKETARSVQTRMSLYAALDAVRRDLEHAPHDSVQWYVTGPHEMVWRDAESSQALRICVVKGRLERCEGLYDERTRQWHTRSVSVLAYDIKELRCVFHQGSAHDSVGAARYTAVAVELLTLSGVHEQALIALGVGALS